jgi:hypothetical protein
MLAGIILWCHAGAQNTRDRHYSSDHLLGTFKAERHRSRVSRRSLVSRWSCAVIVDGSKQPPATEARREAFWSTSFHIPRVPSVLPLSGQ